MDLTQFALVILLVVGAVEAVKAAFDQKWRTVAIIAASAVVGGVCGYYHVQGLQDVAYGIGVGLGASGLVTTAAKINTTPSVEG